MHASLYRLFTQGRRALLAALLLHALPGLAQTLKDPALESLYAGEQYDELQRVSAQRVQAQADDVQAVLGLALAALQRDDAAPRLDAIRRAEACVEKQPRAAPCQYALGAVLGVQAMSEGLFKAARSAGAVRSALTTAVETDPGWYTARSGLVEFYLAAPGVMGGSSAKAAEVARAAPRPEQVRLLEARIALDDRRFDDALQVLAAVPAGVDPALAADARSWGAQAGLGLVNAGQAAKAQAPMERLLRDHPGHAAGAYALARVRAELGAHDEALKLYERATALKGAAFWPLFWRIGIELQQLGRLDEARTALRRFVDAGRGPKAGLDDARKRLVQLGGDVRAAR